MVFQRRRTTSSFIRKTELLFYYKNLNSKNEDQSMGSKEKTTQDMINFLFNRTVGWSHIPNSEISVEMSESVNKDFVQVHRPQARQQVRFHFPRYGEFGSVFVGRRFQGAQSVQRLPFCLYELHRLDLREVIRTKIRTCFRRAAVLAS